MAADQLDRFEADLSQISEMVDPDRLYSEDAYRAIRLLGLATRCCGARAGVPETVAVARESLHIAASSFLPEHHVADARLRQQWNREAVQAEASVQTKLVQRLRATPDVGRDTVAALRRDLDIPKVT